jgi:hypothetical protein
MSLSYVQNGILQSIPSAIDTKILPYLYSAFISQAGSGALALLLCSPISTCLQVLGRKQNISFAQLSGHRGPSHACWIPRPQVALLTEEEDGGRFGKWYRVRGRHSLLKSPENPEPSRPAGGC